MKDKHDDVPTDSKTEKDELLGLEFVTDSEPKETIEGFIPYHEPKDKKSSSKNQIKGVDYEKFLKPPLPPKKSKSENSFFEQEKPKQERKGFGIKYKSI